MAAVGARALHFVFKVGDRPQWMKFVQEVLGMKVLRHEEFEEGCKASCNGPYDGKWSKTMVGYGPEDSNFVLELTYNYGIGDYPRGNDLLGIEVASSEAMQAARDLNWTPMRELSSGGGVELEAPGGYPFQLKEGDRSSNNGDPVRKVTLASTSLEKSMLFWKDTLGMQEAKSATTSAKCLTFGPGQAQLELYQIDSPVDHSKAFGRIAFSIPRQSLPDIQCTVKERWGEAAILTPLVALDTPGKATVEVVILADPDGHEICFVGDEAFRELSQVDPAAEKLLQEAMEADKSKEWFSKKGIPKPTA